MFTHNTDLLSKDYHLSLNRIKDCPKTVMLSQISRTIALLYIEQ